jgi:hypothetical protein
MYKTNCTGAHSLAFYSHPSAIHGDGDGDETGVVASAEYLQIEWQQT